MHLCINMHNAFIIFVTLFRFLFCTFIDYIPSYNMYLRYVDEHVMYAHDMYIKYIHVVFIHLKVTLTNQVQLLKY